jgi:hypothetical protein
MVRLLFTGLCLFWSGVNCALAAENFLQPFAVRNHNPFMGIYGIPAMQSPVVVAPGRSSVQLLFDAVSHFTDAETQSEFIAIDGETYRLALRYTRGLEKQWEIGTEVPVVSHSGGVLDGVINHWHDVFRLPTLGRNDVEDDQIDFQYVADDEALVDVQSATTGVGDVLLFAGKTLRQYDDYSVILRGQLKLPTGDPDRLQGSGGTDISLWGAAARKWGESWSASARLGGAYLGTGDVLPGLQRHWAGFGSVFIGWQAFRSFSLKSQLDVQTPLYENSDIHQLTDTAVQLTFGATARVSKSTYLDISVTEDEFNPDVSSDVAFQIRLRTAH